MFEQQIAKAEAVQREYQGGIASLFRDQARREKVYAPDEHERRFRELRQERARKVDEATAEIRAVTERARKDLAAAEGGDPTALLSGPDLAAAGARKVFVDDDVWSTPQGALAEKLRTVLESGDRASVFAYWRAALSRQDTEGLAHAAPGEVATGGPLRDVLEEMRRYLAGRERLAKAERARETIEGAFDAEMRASSFKDGSPSVAGAMLNRMYGEPVAPAS